MIYIVKVNLLGKEENKRDRWIVNSRKVYMRKMFLVVVRRKID